MLTKGNCIRSGALALTLLVTSAPLALAQAPCASMGHPGPQPRPAPTVQETVGNTTTATVGASHFPVSEPFADPPGANLLETVFQNAVDSGCDEIPNTLPSTPTNPYNLHPDPVVSPIDPTSPTDDLTKMFKRIWVLAAFGHLDINAVDFALDVLEGDPIPGRAYSGLPVLHYNGPNKVRAVEPITDPVTGETVGGNIVVNQIWYDSHIESDVAFIDPSAVMNVPWTITYNINTLNRGHEDFAPFAMYFDDRQDITNPAGAPLPHVAMDQTFFPMEDGTRTTFEIAMAPGRFWNLTYHWGWRIHPPRVQVAENALKTAGPKTLPQWEIDVFGPDPTGSEANKLAAIAMIGDLAPAKRMWNALRAMKAQFLADSFVVNDGDNLHGFKIDDFNLAHLTLDDDLIRNVAGNPSTLQGISLDNDARSTLVNGGFYKPHQGILNLLADAVRGFHQWGNRNQMPDGVSLDPNSDVTLLYVNNTIYGELPGKVSNTQNNLPQWQTRPQQFKIKLFNGDYYPHGYVNVDFGGSRGWENTFQPTVDVGGAGPWFTFGRVHWWINAGGPWGPIIAPPAASTVAGPDDDVVGMHNVVLNLNHDPSRRLRLYQFDPLHHDVAVWSVH